MNAVGEVDLEMPSLAVVRHLINRRGTEELTRITVLLRTSRMTDIRLQDVQVTRLILVMCGAGIVNVGQLIESKFAIERGLAYRRNMSIVIRAQLAHARVPRPVPIPVMQPPPTGYHLQARMDHPQEKAVFKCLMEVPDLPQLFLDPALFHKLPKAAQ